MTPGERLVRERVRREGAISFRDFMEMALYAPGAGYYITGQPERDYFTAPRAHPAFGALVGLQLDQMWQGLGRRDPFTVVELGGGRGLLARDILGSPFRPVSLQVTRYVALERGSAGAITGSPLQALVGEGVPLKDVAGCFLSNELWDAFPVHRVMMRDGRLREAYVALEGDRLVESYREPSAPELQTYLDEYGASLQEGQIAEVNLAMLRHIGDVARALHRGFFIAIDYGYTGAERTRYPQGSLRCFYRHTVPGDPFLHIGEQDITSSVDFSIAVNAAQKAGFTVLGLIAQGAFLKNLGLDVLLRHLAMPRLSAKEYNAEALALRDLARPGQMGDFRVLILGKDVDGIDLDCLKEDNATRRALETRPDLPLPRLTPEHAALVAARYPHLAWSPPEETG